MTDFIKAFQDGQHAAEVSERARREIDQVFNELNEQIAAATGGSLGIMPMQFPVKKSAWDVFNLNFPPEPQKYYWAIGAYNPSVGDSSKRQIAMWSKPPTGYPCKITIGGKSIICEDKEGLELALSELLLDPSIAEVLCTLKNLEPTSEETD
jgi:hypothetical protein